MSKRPFCKTYLSAVIVAAAAVGEGRDARRRQSVYKVARLASSWLPCWRGVTPWRGVCFQGRPAGHDLPEQAMEGVYYKMIASILLFPWTLLGLTLIGYVRDCWLRAARTASSAIPREGHAAMPSGSPSASPLAGPRLWWRKPLPWAASRPSFFGAT